MSLLARLRRIGMAQIACGLCAAWLAGCAALHPSPDAGPRAESDEANEANTKQDASALGGFILDGRFSLTQRAAMQAEQRHAGRLHWKYAPALSTTPAHSELLLSSPLGQGIAEIVQDAHGARLTNAEGKTFAAPDAETLTREVLGYALPLSRLADWVRARPPAAGPAEAHRDELGRLTRLRQDGWLIDYGYADADPRALPRRIQAQRPEEFELRLVVDAWQPLPAEAGAP